MTLVLGLDVGTTTIKAAFFDLDEPVAPVAVAQAPTPRVMPAPGQFEIEAEALWEAVREVCQGAAAQAPGEPSALGISGTACGAWLVDAGGELTRRPILWNDGRAVDVVQEWVADGTVERIFEISGNVPYPGYTLPLLRWLREHDPDSLDRASAVLCLKDWLRLRMTGEVFQDETDASYVPFDIKARRWSRELAEVCGVAEDAERLLPALAEPAHTAGLRAEAAEQLGLPEGLPIALGLTDIVAATVGGGVIRPGRAVTNLGTSSFSTLVIDTCELAPHGVGITAAAPLGRWMRTMVNTSGSMTLDFAAGLVCEGDVGRMMELAAEAEPGADGVTMLPYLSPAGVVSPFVEPNAHGCFIGLRAGHGPREIARAAVEGLACAIADCYSAMATQPEQIVTVGGAARSDLLLEQIAALTGAPVARLDGEEFGCRGAALVAAWAAGLTGGDDGLVAAAEAIEAERVFEPGPATPGLMDRYREAAAATRRLWSGPHWRRDSEAEEGGG